MPGGHTVDDFVNLVTDVRLGANASLDAVKLIRTGPRHVHTDAWRSRQERDSRLVLLARD